MPRRDEVPTDHERSSTVLTDRSPHVRVRVPESRVDVYLTWAWLVASATVLAVLLVLARRLAQQRASWVAGEVAGSKVYLSEDVGPAVVGVLRPSIVVPRWVLALDGDAQRAILLHEREHVRAGDQQLVWTLAMLCVTMPWNAGLWIILARLRQAVELDCDRRVLAAGSDRARYCRLLLDIGERTLGRVPLVAALAEPATTLERRIEAMSRSRARAWRPMVATTVAAAISVAAAHAPPPAAAPHPRLVPGDRQVVGGDTVGRRDALDEAARQHDDQLRHVDSLLAARYPELAGRSDTTTALVGIVFDEHWRVQRHAMRVGGEVTGSAARLLLSLGIDTISGRTRDLGLANRPVNTNVIYVVERAGPVRTGEEGPIGWIGAGARRTDADRSSIPVTPDNSGINWTLRLDSIARRWTPEAFVGHDETIVIAALFTERGTLVGYTVAHEARKFARILVSGPRRIAPREYLRTVFPETRHSGLLPSSGMAIMSDAPQTVLVTGVVPGR
jgi:beta-lactamase regulating signal transducer with metallopeptidase domain